MYCMMREVKLPDGTLGFEYERQVDVQGETQATYQYIKVNGKNIDKSKFELDYWGRIKNIEIL